MHKQQLNAIEPEIVDRAQSSVPTDDLITLVVGTFQALGDRTRLKILYTLKEHEICVRDLAILVGVSESAVSHQLRLLRDRHLVTQRRNGNVMYYSLNDCHLAVLFQEAEYHADHVHHGISDHVYPE